MTLWSQIAATFERVLGRSRKGSTQKKKLGLLIGKYIK
jgi:hypothetical protein